MRLASTIAETFRHLCTEQANPKAKLKPEKIAKEGIKILAVYKEFCNEFLVNLPRSDDNRYRYEVKDGDRMVPAFNEIKYLRELSAGVTKLKLSIVEDLKELEKLGEDGKGLADQIAKVVNMAIKKKQVGK